jgi:hypothetical protein
MAAMQREGKADGPRTELAQPRLTHFGHDHLVRVDLVYILLSEVILSGRFRSVGAPYFGA